MQIEIGLGRRITRGLCLGLLVAMTSGLAGCYGRSPLAHGLYKLNGQITDDKLVHSLVMWGLIILPAYELAVLGDILILNLVEYWTGESLDLSYEVEDQGYRMALVNSEDGREAVLKMSRNGESIAEQRVTKVSDTFFEIRDPNGTLTGTIEKTDSGDLLLADTGGRVVRTITVNK